MSTRQIITGVGTVVGAFFGAPQLGYVIGSLVGNAVDPQIIRGPSIGDVATQTSQEGGPRPIVYGLSPPMSGNIIATGPPRKVVKTKRQGKGGPKVKTEHVFRTYAVGICEGPISGVVRVWRNGELVYDVKDSDDLNYHGEGQSLVEILARRVVNNEVWTQKTQFFDGTYEQEAPPELEEIFGVGTTPAHRGTAYMLVVDDDLTDLRGAIPQYMFQVQTHAQSLQRLVYPPGSHTWEKPQDLEYIEVLAIGGGGGGASGGADNLAVYPNPGAGGGGGGVGRATIQADDLADTVAVEVGAGGDGGAAVSANGPVGTPAPGLPGEDGGDTSFGSHVEVGGGMGGTVPEFAGGSVGGDGDPPGVNPPSWNGGNGALTSNNIALATGDETEHGAGGGGAGGSNNGVGGATPGPGGDGSTAESTSLAGGAPGVNGSSSGGSGSAASAGSSSSVDDPRQGGGGGGGGGGGSSSGGPNTGGAGGDGGAYGGGGGGGGNAHRGPSGRGGAGGDGVVVVDHFYSTQLSTLQQVVTEICARAGLPSDLIDVSRLVGHVHGFMVTNSYAALEALRALSQVYLFDAVSYDGRVRFMPRGEDTVATITEDELLDDERDIESDKRADPIQIPRVLNITYHDVLGSLAPDKQTSERSGDRRATGEVQIQSAVVMPSSMAAQVVAINHKAMIEDQKGELHFALSDARVALIPSDAIFLQWEGRTERVRLTKCENFDGFQEYVALRDRQSAYTSNVEGMPASPVRLPANQSVGPTLMEILDIPILRDADDAVGLSMYVAISGVSDVWQGATIELSYDGGENYVDSETVETSTVMGELVTALEDHPAEFPDVTHSCFVRIDTDGGELEPSSLAGMLNRANLALIGDEIVQFAGAVETSDAGVWEVSYFLRGRKGTATAGHPPGTRFVMLGELSAIPVSVTSLGRTLTLRATSIGAPVESATIKSITYTGQSQTERAPAYVEAQRQGANAVITWQGVGRLGSGANTAHGARFAGYRVSFDDGSSPGLSVDVTVETLTQDVSGFSSPVTISVQQLNDLTGAGPAATVDLI